MSFFDEKFRDLLRPEIESKGYHLVKVYFQNKKSSDGILRVDVERMNLESVDTRDCIILTKLILGLLEKNDPVPNVEYCVEVGSPGVERELLSLEDYKRFTGRDIVFRPKVGTSIFNWLLNKGLKKVYGSIVGVDNNRITFSLKDLRDKEEEITICYDDIGRANLVFV